MAGLEKARIVLSRPAMRVTQHQGVGMETIHGAVVFLADPAGDEGPPLHVHPYTELAPLMTVLVINGRVGNP